MSLIKVVVALGISLGTCVKVTIRLVAFIFLFIAFLLRSASNR